MKNSAKQQFTTLLSHADSVLLVGAKNWALDDAAALLALQKILIAQKKNVVVVAPDEIPTEGKFLAGKSEISKSLGNGKDLVISVSTENAKIQDISSERHEDSVELVLSVKDGFLSPDDVSFRKHAGNYDAIVVVGANNLEQCGEIFSQHAALFSDTPVINVSVSPANEFFGRVNFVDAAASSVCELLAEIIFENNVWKTTLDAETATMILTGIVAETESFLAQSTSARAFELAAKLQELGAAQSDVIENLYKQKTFRNLKVLGRLLNNLALDRKHQMSWTKISDSDFELIDATPDDIDGWIDQLLRHINGADFVAMFVEHREKSVVMIRLNSCEIDLSELQKLFPEKFQTVRNGVYFEFGKNSISEIQAPVLRALADLQERRLRIAPGTAIEKAELIEKSDDTPPRPATINEKKFNPRAPENVPFETTPNFSDAHQPADEKIKTAEVTVRSSTPLGNPSWLKK